MNYSNSHKLLEKLGIASEEDAEELEDELNLRFEDFTPEDRRTWLRQNAYLECFSKIGTVSSAAKTAGVTALKAQRWERYDILGFTRRLEIAALEFNDSIKEKAHLRASDPNAPAALLIELLRAYIPEEFSRNRHKCDESKSEDLLHSYRESVRHDTGTGYSDLRKLAQGAENAHPKDDWPTEPNAYPDDNYHTDMNDYPAEPVSPDGKPPLDESGNTQNPSVAITPSPVLGEGWGEGDTPGSRATFSTSTQNPAPRTSNPTRAQRREQLRQQRKAEKKNTFPVKRF